LFFDFALGDRVFVVSFIISDEKMKAHSEENWNKVLNGLKKVVEEKFVSV
jgi:hypothetical protein